MVKFTEIPEPITLIGPTFTTELRTAVQLHECRLSDRKKQTPTAMTGA
jgi:hypothetical protein